MSMTPLVRDLLINGLMAGTAVKTAKKKSIGVAYYAMAGAIGCLALVFFAIAGYGLLLESFTMPVAAAITGAVIAMLSIAVGTTGYVRMQKKKIVKKPSFQEGGILDNIEGTVKSLLEGFEEPVKDNPKLALLVAALAGFAAGDQLGDRVH